MSDKIKYLTKLAVLLAIILILSFTPIGYIRTLGLEITLIVVPVVVGAILLGPTGGTILGAAFGLTSFFQCFGMSPFGAVLLAINPFYTFILCVVPRVLMGFLTGLVYKVMSEKRSMKKYSVYVASLVGPFLNTFFFMSGLVLFFYSTDFIQGFVETLGAKNPFVFILLFVGTNGLVEFLACFAIGCAIVKALHAVEKK